MAPHGFASSYYRGTFHAGAAAPGFPGIAAGFTFNAKCATISNVPLEDRGFGNIENNEDYAVATRKYGNGRIAFFGDVNCQEETARLIMAFCRGSSKPGAVQPVVSDMDEVDVDKDESFDDSDDYSYDSRLTEEISLEDEELEIAHQLALNISNNADSMAAYYAHFEACCNDMRRSKR